MKCPNFNDKKTRAAFNEVVVALGGEAIKISEQKDYKLQMKRADKNAIFTAYKLFDAVDDHGPMVDAILEYASNGNISGLQDYINKTINDAVPQEGRVNEASRIPIARSAYDKASIYMVNEKIHHDEEYSAAISYIAYLISINENSDISKIYDSLIDDIDSPSSKISGDPLLSMANNDTGFSAILSIISNIYRDGAKISIGDLMSINGKDSSLYRLIDDNVSFRLIKEYFDGKVTIFDLLDKPVAEKLTRALVEYMSGDYDVEGEYSSVVAFNSTLLTSEYAKTLNQSNISTAGGIMEGVHYTVAVDGTIIAADMSFIPKILSNTPSNFLKFSVPGISPEQLFEESVKLSKIHGYRINIDKENNTVIISKKNRAIDRMIEDNVEKINMISKFISRYYEDTHAKHRSNLPSAMAHLSKTVVGIDDVISDSINVISEIVSEAEFILGKSIIYKQSSGKGPKVVSGIHSTGDLSSIKNSVIIHQLDVDLLPLAQAMISAISEDVAMSGDKNNISKFAVLKSKINDIRGDLNSIADINYKNILSILMDKYGVNMDAISDNASRSEVKRWLYMFKYLNKSDSKELKLVAFALSSINSEVAETSRHYKKLDRLIELGAKIKKESSGVFRPYKYFEKNDKGEPTGFVKDSVRWGEFIGEYRRFEKYLLDKFGADGLYDFSIDPNIMQEYKDEVNEWIKNNTCMPTDTKYFNAINKLSSKTYSTYTEYRKLLKKRMDLLAPEDFVYSTPSYVSFIEAFQEYMQIFSPIDMDGNFKEFGTEAYNTYRELMEFSKIMGREFSAGESKMHSDIIALAKDKLNATQYIAFCNKFCSIKTDNKSNLSDSEIEANYNFNRAMRQYDSVINDPEFIENNPNIIEALSELYLRTTYAYFDDDAYAPLSFLKKRNIDESVPSHMFTLSGDFVSDYSNPDYKKEFEMFGLYPNLEKYKNNEYNKFTADEKEYIRLTIDIIHDINMNNGTISMYGPVIPQVSVGFWTYAMRCGFINAIKYFSQNRDVDITLINGFSKTGRVPVAVFSKYTSMLEHAKSLDRDLYRVLALAHRESLVNKVSSNKLYSLHTILHQLSTKGFSTDYSIARNKIYREFGIDVHGTEVQEKGDINLGMIAKNMVVPAVRALQLGFHLVSFAGNMVATDAMIKSDKRFYRIRDINGSISFAAASIASSLRRKFSDSNVPDDKMSAIVRSLNIKGLRAENRFRHRYGARLAKIFTDEFLYFGYSATEAMAIFPIVMGVMKNIKYLPAGFKVRDKYGSITDIQPGFYNKQQFLDLFYRGGNRRSLLRLFYGLKGSLYDAMAYNETSKTWEYDTDRYSEFEIKSGLHMASTISTELLSNATGRFNESIDGVSEAFAAIFGQYRQFLFNLINMVFTKTTYDINSRAETEGLYYSLWAATKKMYHIVTFQISKAKADNLKPHQISNLGILANLTLNMMILNYIATVIKDAVYEGLLEAGDDEEDELGELGFFDRLADTVDPSKLTTRLTALVIAGISRGSTELSAPLRAIELLYGIVSTEPAAMGPIKSMAELIIDQLENLFRDDMPNPRTTKEFYNELRNDYGIDESIIDPYSVPEVEYERNRDGSLKTVKDAYGNTVYAIKGKKQRYHVDNEFDLDKAARVTIPGYHGFSTGFIDIERTATREYNRMLPNVIYNLLTDRERKNKWKSEEERNRQRAIDRYNKEME